MESLRELTDTELEIVSGGLAGAAVGDHFAAVLTAISSLDLHVVFPFGGSVTLLFTTAVAGAFGG